MIGVITGDIIRSRELKDQGIWLEPLRELFAKWGENPGQWDFYRGDSFQLECPDPADLIRRAIRIKAQVKAVESGDQSRRKSKLDVRLGIGIGMKSFDSDRVTQSNGDAFIRSGEALDQLHKDRRTMAVASPSMDLDETINLILRLGCMAMDDWTTSSAQLAAIVFRCPELNQSEIGQMLGITQHSVSGRYKRAFLDEIIDMELLCRDKIKKLAL